MYVFFRYDIWIDYNLLRFEEKIVNRIHIYVATGGSGSKKTCPLPIIKKKLGFQSLKK